MKKIVRVIAVALLLMGAGPYQNPAPSNEYGPFPTYEAPAPSRISPQLAWDLYTVFQADRRPPSIPPYITPAPQFDMNQLFPVPQTQIFRPWYLRPYPQSQRSRPTTCTHVNNRFFCP